LDARPFQRPPTRVSLGDLRRAGRKLSELRAMSDGLIRSGGSLATLTQTVRFAAANADSALGAGFRCQAGGAFADDKRLADTLATQVTAETAVLDAIGKQAAEAARVADVTVEGYLRDRQAELTLVQTTVIGGLLMVLSAIQAFDYKVPLPGPLHAPLIALLGGLALALPMVVLPWLLLDMGRTRRSRLLPIGALALVGAAMGWLATAFVSRVLLDQLAAPSRTVLFAGIGASLVALADYALFAPSERLAQVGHPERGWLGRAEGFQQHADPARSSGGRRVARWAEPDDAGGSGAVLGAEQAGGVGQVRQARCRSPVVVDLDHSAATAGQGGDERVAGGVGDVLDQGHLVLGGPALVLVVWQEPAGAAHVEHVLEQLGGQRPRVDHAEGRHVRDGSHRAEPIPAQPYLSHASEAASRGSGSAEVKVP
jgi:hypothetical protein